MNSIDIVDPQFSLIVTDSFNVPEVSDSFNVPEVSDINEITFTNNQINQEIVGGSPNKNDRTMFIYIAVAFFLGLLGLFVYKKFISVKNKKNSNENYLEGCPAGFCTMNQNKMI